MEACAEVLEERDGVVKAGKPALYQAARASHCGSSDSLTSNA